MIVFFLFFFPVLVSVLRDDVISTRLLVTLLTPLHRIVHSNEQGELTARVTNEPVEFEVK